MQSERLTLPCAWWKASRTSSWTQHGVLTSSCPSLTKLKKMEALDKTNFSILWSKFLEWRQWYRTESANDSQSNTYDRNNDTKQLSLHLILSRRLCNPTFPHTPSTTHPPPPPQREGNTYKTDNLVLNGGMSKKTRPSSINVVTCVVLRPWCTIANQFFSGSSLCFLLLLLFSLLFAISGALLVFRKTMKIFHWAKERTTH